MVESLPTEHAGLVSDNDPVNPLPLNTQPILKLESEGDASLTDFRLYCNVLSVYRIDEQPQASCAVLFEISFDLEDRNLEHAWIPTSIAHTTPITVSIYPDQTELVSIPGGSVNTTMSVNPTIAAGVASVNGLSASRQTNRPMHECLCLDKYVKFLGNEVDVKWIFNNRTSDIIFPSTIRLLVVATKTTNIKLFPFKLRILPKLEVKLRPRRRRFWARGLAPRGHHNGWTIDIGGDFAPDLAREVLNKCRHPREDPDENRYWPSVGLHAAVDNRSYG